MDTKGITWVGDIYQKLEARLLEVEEIMCEEAVRYVENQMQTVSDSVKKFYSDVMQDLCSPDSEDPMNGAISKLPVELGADDGTYIKPKIEVKEKCGKVKDMEQLTEGPKMTADYGMDCLPSCKRTSDRRTSRQHSKESLSNKSAMDISKNSKCKNMSPKATSGTETSLSKYVVRYSSICELSDPKLEVSYDQKARHTTPGSVVLSEHFCIERSKNEIENVTEHIPDMPFGKQSSDMVPMIEAGRHEEMDRRASSSDVLLEECNNAGNFINSRVVSLVESSGHEYVQTDKFAYEDDYKSNSDEWGIDLNRDSTLVEEDMEIIQQEDKARLEETCILVNGDEFNNVPYEGKNRPYRKKIRDVFCSRERSVRKEYEQLTAQCSNDSKSNEVESRTSLMPTLSMQEEEVITSSEPPLSIKEANRSTSHDLSESEWELV